MKQRLMALVLAGALMGSLTACTARDNNPGSAGDAGASVQGPASGSVNDSASGNVSGNANGGSAAGGSVNNGSASGGSMAGSAGGGTVAEGPAGSAYSNGRVNYSRQSSVGKRAGDPNCNPYLNDGSYRAGDNGTVGAPANQNGRGLTDAARDMVRGTGNALRDVGNGVRNAARDVTGR